MSTIEIVYTWPNGKEEVRYRRVKDSESARKMIAEVDDLRMKFGSECPYSYRTVPGSPF